MHLRRTFFRFAPLCAALFPALLAAQEVEGRVTSGTGGAPGALVELLDLAGRPAASAATDSTGAFRVAAPVAGSYRLRAGQVGFRSDLSEPFSLAAGERRVISLAITPRVFAVEGLVVAGRPRCEATPASGEGLGRVWEEARKALALTVRTARDSVFGYDFATYSRVTDARTDEMLDDSTRTRRIVGAIPFVSAPAAELRRLGFVRPAGARVTFFGPDAEVLLSDDFLSRHCFSLREGTGAEAGLVGLAFEPLPSQGRPDVRGLLWLDARNGELRHLEWQYTRVQGPARYAPRGRADFVRLPGGAWIIRAWWLRFPTALPIVAGRGERFTLFYDADVRRMREVGGSVARMWVAKGGALP